LTFQQLIIGFSGAGDRVAPVALPQSVSGSKKEVEAPPLII
jgi:hypothetical protein